MNTGTVVNLLIAARSSIDAILEELAEDEKRKTQQPQQEACPHPIDQRLNLSVLGNDVKSYQCKLCGKQWEEK